MPTRPKADPTSITADARRVLLAARKYAPQLRAAEKGRKAKLFPGGFDAFLAATTKSVAAAEKQVGAQSVRKASSKGATVSELDARVALQAQIAEIRDAVSLTPGVDKNVARAFAFGRKLSLKSTPGLLEAANAIAEAYADPASRKVAAAAGVTPAKLKRLAAVRDTLANADATQGAQIAARKTGTKTKEAAVASLAKAVAHIRKVAGSVLRTDKLALTSFASTLPRHTVKKRAKKAATAGAPATTAAKTSTT